MTKLLEHRRWLTAALAVLGGLAGLVYGMFAPPTYTATAYVLVVAVPPADGTSAVSYAQAYARLARQVEVVGPAANASRGTASISDLRRSVQTSASPDAPVIEVSGSAGDAQRAADITNLVAEGLVNAGRAQAPSTRMNLVLLSPAYPPPDSSSPRLMLSVAVGAGVGLSLGGLVLLTRPAGDERSRRGTDRPTGLRPDRPRPGRPSNAVEIHPNPVLTDSP